MPEHFDLETFRTRHFDYRPGHHVAFFGPTQLVGKTTTAYQLLRSVIAMYPEIQPVTLCMKHKDKVIAHWSRDLGFRETPSWPPQPKFSELPPFGTKPPGYTLWPPQTLVNPVADNERLAREFIRAITWNRGHTPSLTHANELYGLLAELNLPKLKLYMRELLTAVITRDSGAGHGLWYETQKPSGTQGVSVPGFFFNSAEHMLLGKDGEERNRRRYAEIGCGISPDSIEREVLKLDPFSWLYLRRSGPEWCVIDAYDERLKV
jgi:hypothetical protein